jgi:hypothetical protein
MSEHNSPTFKQGRADGKRDGHAIAKELAPTGPTPPYPDWPKMYMRGYDEGLAEGQAEADDDTDDDSAEPFTVDTGAFYA